MSIQKDAFQESTFPIMFNQAANILPIQVGPNAINNTIRIKLPQERTFLHSEAALDNLFVNYSWFNITAARGNNILTLLWGATYYSVIIPNGFYDLPALNQFLHEWMDPAIRQPQRQYVAPAGANAITSGMSMYLISDGTAPPLGAAPGSANASNGSHQPLIFLTEDVPAYRFTVTSYGIPTSAPPTHYTFPSGYVDPGAFGGGGTYYPQLLFGPNLPPASSAPVTPPAGAVLGTTQVILGMGSPGATSFNYEPGTVKQATGITVITPVASNGPFPPQLEEFSSIIVNFSLVNVPGINISAQAIAMFSPTVLYPNQNSVVVTFPKWIPIANTAPQSDLDLFLTTDDGVPLPVQDYGFSATVLIRQKPERPLSETDRQAYVDNTLDRDSLYPAVQYSNAPQFNNAFQPGTNSSRSSLLSKRFRIE